MILEFQSVTKPLQVTLRSVTRVEMFALEQPFGAENAGSGTRRGQAQGAKRWPVLISRARGWLRVDTLTSPCLPGDSAVPRVDTRLILSTLEH